MNREKRLYNPAWDFQYVVDEAAAGTEFCLRSRLVYKPYVDREEIEQLYQQWTAELQQEPVGHESGIVLVRDFGNLLAVRCYPAQLNQVLMNLVMNACDALEGKGTIDVSTRPRSDGVTLEIADDGPGIPAAVRERIFEPFFTTKPVGQGTGLGLSISHGIVERHGGNLSVECPPKGGTRFTIELPLVAKPPDGEEEASAA